MNRRTLQTFLVVAASVCLAACAAILRRPALYFSSPEESVTRTTALLRSQDFRELACYYDLSGTGIDRRELESGAFFIRTDPPDTAHPGGLWKYKEPFAPGYTFLSAANTDEAGVIEVTVGIEIDEGGGMVQRGRTSYQLRKSAAGYQFLPAILAATKTAFLGDPAFAATGGISRLEAAERAGVDVRSGSWHAFYSPALSTWFFTAPNQVPVALERVAVPNPPLPPTAPPGFVPRPWRWTLHPMPAMDVTAVDELCQLSDGATRFGQPMPGFADLLPSAAAAGGEIEVPRGKIWAVLDRARDRNLRVHVSVANPSGAGAHAVLTLVPTGT